jgi:hypothetical protein
MSTGTLKRPNWIQDGRGVWHEIRRIDADIYRTICFRRTRLDNHATTQENPQTSLCPQCESQRTRDTAAKAHLDKARSFLETLIDDENRTEGAP